MVTAPTASASALAIARPGVARPSLSPDAEELSDWVTAKDAMSWARFGDNYDNYESPEASWLVHLGCEPTSLLQEFGAVAKENYDEQIVSRKVTRNRAKQAGHGARVFLSIDFTIEQQHAIPEKERLRKAELEW